MDANTKYSLTIDQIAENTVSDITLLVPMTHDVDTMGAIFELDSMGSLFWSAFKQHDNLQSVQEALETSLQAENIAFEKDELTQDIASFRDSLVEIGAIKNMQ